jgi:hypothetical protein
MPDKPTLPQKLKGLARPATPPNPLTRSRLVRSWREADAAVCNTLSRIHECAPARADYDNSAFRLAQEQHRARIDALVVLRSECLSLAGEFERESNVA